MSGGDSRRVSEAFTYPIIRSIPANATQPMIYMTMLRLRMLITEVVAQAIPEVHSLSRNGRRWRLNMRSGWKTSRNMRLMDHPHVGWRTWNQDRRRGKTKKEVGMFGTHCSPQKSCWTIYHQVSALSPSNMAELRIPGSMCVGSKTLPNSIAYPTV